MSWIGRIGFKRLFAGVAWMGVVVCAAQGSRADPFAAGEVEVSLYWNVSQGMEGDDEEVPPSAGETSVDLSLSLEGPDSNRADATVVASLEAGWIRGFASGITPENPSGETGGIATAWARGELEDRLTFTVAPGTYSEDVIVSVSGTVSGGFIVTGGGSSSTRALERKTATSPGTTRMDSPFSRISCSRGDWSRKGPLSQTPA